MSQPVPASALGARGRLKQFLARLASRRPAAGVTLLIYHRIGGGTTDELDIPTATFARHLDLLSGHRVLSLDDALDALDRDDPRPAFVLTFDDGFDDLYRNAWPLLRERRLPFTVYLASAYVGATMRWEGAKAAGQPGQGLTWEQLREMVASGLCTVGNHTHDHVRPEQLTPADLDACTAAIETELGLTPTHFAYPWGVRVPAMEDALRARFRSAATGELGRNRPGADPIRLRRVPVRRTDPDSFFSAKLRGELGPERLYAAIVAAAKRLGVGARRA